MAISREKLIQTFEHRYDYHSARAVFARALKTLSLADKAGYSSLEVARVCAFLRHMRDTDALIERLQRLAALDGPPSLRLPPHPALVLPDADDAPMTLPARPAAWGRRGQIALGAVGLGAAALLMLAPVSGAWLPWALVVLLSLACAALVGWIGGQSAAARPSPRPEAWQEALDELEEDLEFDRKALAEFDRRLEASVRATARQTVQA